MTVLVHPEGGARSQPSESRRSDRQREDQSWIKPLSVPIPVSSWTPQKQHLAREVEDLRTTQKDTARRLADALEHGRRVERDLKRSNSDNRLFREAAERDRTELENAYLRVVDLEVASANTLLEEESHYQREVAQAGMDRQRGILMAEAQSALTGQAASSDQRMEASI